MSFINFKEVVHGPKIDKMKSDRLYGIERNISARISWILIKIFPKIKANHVSFFSLFLLLSVVLLNFIKSTEFMVSIFVTLLQLLMLYSINMTDKIDGEIARYKNQCTQKGMYLDRTVHFFYPISFYFSIGYFFYLFNSEIIFLLLAILVAFFHINLIFFGETRLSIKDIIIKKNIDIKDYIPSSIDTSYKKRVFPLRILDYLSYLIYAWTLFFYVAVVLVSIYDFRISFSLYLFQIFIALILNGYKIFFYFPNRKLFKEGKI